MQVCGGSFGIRFGLDTKSQTWNSLGQHSTLVLVLVWSLHPAKLPFCSPSKFGQPEQPETHAHERNHAKEVVVGLIHVSRVPLHHGRAGMYTVRERAECSITHERGKA